MQQTFVVRQPDRDPSVPCPWSGRDTTLEKCLDCAALEDLRKRPDGSIALTCRTPRREVTL